MKRILVLGLFMILLLTACGISDVDEEVMGVLLADEFDGTVKSVEILSKETKEKTSNLEVLSVIEINGIAQEAVLQVKCIYDEESSAWKLHYYEVDNGGWTYSPTTSAIESSSKVIDDYMKSKVIKFENEVSLFDETFEISEISSENLNLENKEEAVKFFLEYKNDDFVGKSECSADLEFNEDKWIVTDIKYDPILLEWKNESNITTSEKSLKDYIDNHTHNGIYLESKELDCNIRSEDITEFSIVDEAKPFQTNVAIAKVKVNANFDVATADSELIIEYRKSKEGNWVIKDIHANQEESKINVIDNLVGTWKGYYILDNKKRFADLKITKFIESGNMYEGVLSFGSSDTFKSESGTYYFTMSFDLNNRSIYLEAGNWIVKPSSYSYSTVDFNLLLDDENKLTGKPNTFWGNSNDVCEFVRVTEETESN